MQMHLANKLGELGTWVRRLKEYKGFGFVFLCNIQEHTPD